MIEVELLALILSVLAGFGGLSYQIGRRSNAIEILAKRLDDHEDGCAERADKVDGRLAEGSTKMAVMDTKIGEIRDDVKEIKEFMLKAKD